ncbi:MAG: deoxyribonuclease IV [Synergistaceae bacterium]|jgi:deoxyribonuclease-4|nr:deoxyribonuclease IV [Synergistaceae bacterium]
MPLLGAHISSAGGLHRAVERASALGCEAMQIFTHNPLQWQGKTPSPAGIDAFRRTLLESGVKKVTAHASYLINLAGDGYVRNHSIDAVIREIELCYQLGIDSLVLHPGSSRGGSRAGALSNLAGALEKIIDRTIDKNVVILLETMAGQGDILGSSIDEFETVFEAMSWNNRLGVCADVCHVFGAGVDVRSEEGYLRFVSSLDRHFGLGRVGCWHLSDNKGALGSNIDRHEHIGQGAIGIIPFSMLVSDERFADTPAILETPKEGVGDAGNLALLRKLRGAERQAADTRRSGGRG